MKITRRFSFAASHRLFNPSLPEAENRRIFQQCHERHGHNFTLDVTVEGEIDPATGMVMNFHELKKAVDTRVIRYFDHRDFEKDIPEFAGQVQTVENIIRIIWNRLQPHLPAGVKLSGIKLMETENNWAEYSA
jgi:6-pyruvoyltetrahydropterin/6-carboxytetrahydropterin synthase